MQMPCRRHGLYVVKMQASSIDQQNNEDQEYERAHTDAMFEVNDISEKVDVVEKFIRHTKKNINELTEELVSARNNVALLKENLVLAREKVARLQNDKRTLEIGCVVADEKIVIRLVDKISDVLAKIDELADLGFELPFRIGMNLEMRSTSRRCLTSATRQQKQQKVGHRGHVPSLPYVRNAMHHMRGRLR